MSLAKIQALIKAPKNQFNSFGKYKYRSCEDILEAVKLVVNPLGFYITLSDEVVQVGDRVYFKATAELSDGTGNGIRRSIGFAREAEQKKGMDESQISGMASSYARKYALCGLFALDDSKDADTMDNTESPLDAECANVRLITNLEELEAMFHASKFKTEKQFINTVSARKKQLNERDNTNAR